MTTYTPNSPAWVDNNTQITSARLNHMETGIDLAHNEIQPGTDTGRVTMFFGTTIPGAWLKCNGQAVSRSTYSALFAIIGTTYGTGDGSTTFNVPDLRGCFIMGLDDGRGLDSGRTVGSYQADNNAPHNHTLTDQVYSASSKERQDMPARRMGGSVTGNGQTTGSYGTEFRPKNISGYWMIKT